MSVKDLAEKLSLEICVGGKSLQNEVKGGYCGDLLSWVIGRASPHSAWVTVMGNENAVAVALLADISCIILAENAELDKKAAVRAEENNIAVLKSDKSAFDIAVGIAETLGNIKK